MCGLAGFWQPGGFEAGSARKIIDSMAARIAHRGPDHQGAWLDGAAGIAFGHRRLSIIDLSPAGNQPMVSACQRWIVMLNGEIYNHLAIRRLLESERAAPIWRGHSDTETLLAAIAAWGIERTLQSIAGMFAVALWDRTSRTLILARDRAGEKPLYYGWQRGVFLFASEIKALKMHPLFSGEVSVAAPAEFLLTNYIPAPGTIYESIYKLPAGTWLSLTSERAQDRHLPEPKPYWALRDVVERGATRPFSGTLAEAADELEALLSKTVSEQMLSDVPLGAFLSGGVDSTLIVALMQKISERPVKTFTIGMPDAGLDESKAAEAVAKHLGTEHECHLAAAAEAQAVIPRLPDIWDEPFADSSQIPTWLVCKFARQQVTVALSGDGGDESFLGYSHYTNLRQLWRWRSLSWMPWRLAANVAEHLAAFGLRPAHAQRLRAIGHLLAASTKQEMIDRYLDRYRGDPIPSREKPKFEPWWPPGGVLDVELVAAWRDTTRYLPDDILVKVDRAAMSLSLETRAPLVDHQVIEFAWRLPLDFKIKGAETKRVMREVLYRYVPRSLIQRPKQGFSIPLGKWLRGELRAWAEDLLESGRLAGTGFDAGHVRRLWEQHLNGMDLSERLWGVLMLQAFYAHKS